MLSEKVTYTHTHKDSIFTFTRNPSKDKPKWRSRILDQHFSKLSRKVRETRKVQKKLKRNDDYNTVPLMDLGTEKVH